MHQRTCTNVACCRSRCLGQPCRASRRAACLTSALPPCAPSLPPSTHPLPVLRRLRRERLHRRLHRRVALPRGAAQLGEACEAGEGEGTHADEGRSLQTNGGGAEASQPQVAAPRGDTMIDAVGAGVARETGCGAHLHPGWPPGCRSAGRAAQPGSRTRAAPPRAPAGQRQRHRAARVERQQGVQAAAARPPAAAAAAAAAPPPPPAAPPAAAQRAQRTCALAPSSTRHARPKSPRNTSSVCCRPGSEAMVSSRNAFTFCGRETGREGGRALLLRGRRVAEVMRASTHALTALCGTCQQAPLGALLRRHDTDMSTGTTHVRVVGALPQHKLEQQAVVLGHRGAAVGPSGHLQAGSRKLPHQKGEMCWQQCDARGGSQNPFIDS